MTGRYAVGDRVRVSRREAEGHCRTPYYLRGKRGVITRHCGDFGNPEALAYHRPGLPLLPLYQVEFPFDEVWGAQHCEDRVRIAADIYGHWLEPDAETAP
jgi:nitrile hydratase subunit beta